MDELEARTLLSTLPAPPVSSTYVNLSVPFGPQSYNASTTVNPPASTTDPAGNNSSPTIIVNPANPQQMAAVWENTSSAGTFAEGAYSTDGGNSWTLFTPADDLPVFTQGNPQGNFLAVTDVSAAFDRNGDIYTLVSEHTADNSAGTGGELVLNKFGINADGSLSHAIQDKIVDSWTILGATNVNQDLKPTIAVDTNLANGLPNQTNVYTNATINQADPHAGNVYIAWGTNDLNGSGVGNFTANTIKMVVSTDGGNTFGAPFNADTRGNVGHQADSAPQIAISQGSATVAPGQVSVVWDDFGSGNANGSNLDQIDFTSIQPGNGSVADLAVPAKNTGPVNGTIAVSGANNPAVNTTFPIAVPAGITPTNLAVKVEITHPTLANVSLTLISPDGKTKIPLVAPGAATGANFGASSFGDNAATVFVPSAPISLANAAAPYVNKFSTPGLANLLNKPLQSGNWLLQVTDNGTAAGSVAYLADAELAVTQGFIPTPAINVIAGGKGVDGNGIAVRGALLNSYPLASTVDPLGIGPGITIASDNTLGAYSATAGNLYIAYTDRDTNPAITTNPADNTDIYVITSTNGGLTWNPAVKVNNDSAAIDGYSEAYLRQGLGVETGRPQFQPSIAVDGTTGSVVVTYYDARYDSADARVAMTLATSVDGGQSFGGETPLNQPLNAYDEATSSTTVNLGPVLDNQSPGNPKTDATFSYGSHQSVAVWGGQVFAAWSSNLNGGFNPLATDHLDIRVAHATISSGPRIVSGTSGPVGDPSNTSPTAADLLNDQPNPINGGPQAQAFEVTFDRAVDANTFTPDQVIIQEHDANGNVLQTLNGVAAGIVVTPVASSLSANGLYTQFIVTFPPDTIPGTIAYEVGSGISDDVNWAVSGQTNSTGNSMDQNGNGYTLAGSYTIDEKNNAFSMPTPTNGIPLGGSYVRSSLPIVIPGPHVIATDVGKRGVTAIQATNPGVGYTSVPTVTISGGGGSGATATAAISGVVTGVAITDGGVNYTSAPQVIFSGGGGSGAAGTAVLTNGVVTSVLITNPGAGYTSTPAVSFNGGGGAGAAGNASIGEGVTGYFITNPGSGYTSVPTVTLSGGGGSGAAADAVLSGVVSAIQVNNPGSGYTFTPTVTLSVPQGDPGSGAAATAIISGVVSAISVANPGFGYKSVPTVTISGGGGSGATAVAVLSGGEVSAIEVTNPGSGYTSAPMVTISGSGVSTAMATASVTIGVTGFIITNPGSGYVTPPTVTITGGGGSGAAATAYTITSIPGAAGPQPTADNEVLNAAQSSLNVTFNQDIANSSFTPAQVLSIIGPAGSVGPALSVTPFNDGTEPGTSRTFAVNFATQALSGTYTVQLASTIASATNAAAGISSYQLDSNLNAGVYDLMQIAAPGQKTTITQSATTPLIFPQGTTPVTYTNNVPLSIPAGSTQTSSISVPSSYLIQGETLQLNIFDTADPNLSAVLIPPPAVATALGLAPGQGIPLFANVGANGGQANFLNTLFDDSNPSVTTPIVNGGAPFSGRYTTQGLLTLAALNQQSAAGTWQLQITNAAGANVPTATLTNWSLTFMQLVPNSGLGEPVADQATGSFRIFTMDPTNAVSSQSWTSVGPAPIGALNGNNSGMVGGIAVDPSDPSGNTVYVAGADGGIWKTTNFLTTNPAGPTYIPLTDFGPASGINIGGLTIFGRNNNPQNSIIFAVTGFADGLSTPGGGANNVTGNQLSKGVGVLRSMDGGQTWQLLDSTVNVDSAGNYLPLSSVLRDHAFVGSTSYKIAVDPNPTPAGNVIVYLTLNTALGGNAGVWVSYDSGNTWGLVNRNFNPGLPESPVNTNRIPNLAGQATDVAFDNTSGATNTISNPTGNLQVIYAAIQGQGVFISPNEGQNWSLLTQGSGDLLIQNGDSGNRSPLPNATLTAPNGSGRIVLATPALVPVSTPNADTENQIYSGWIYAAILSGGQLNGIYMSKDHGHNWVQVMDPTALQNVNGFQPAIPDGSGSANVAGGGNYDVTASPVLNQGDFNLTLAIDPQNPNIIYLGGLKAGNEAGLIRLDTTDVADPHNFTTSDTNNDGGTLQTATTGPVTLNGLGLHGYNPLANPTLNLLYQPGNVLSGDATIVVSDASGFSNSGNGVKWIPFDLPGNSVDQHRLAIMIDPTTGLPRLIIGDNNGVFTGVDNNGTFVTGSTGKNANGVFTTGINGVSVAGNFVNGIGTHSIALGSRNGNLSITQFYDGAAQPSSAAAQVAYVQNLIDAGLLYATSQSNGSVYSPTGILTTGAGNSAADPTDAGNLVWNENSSPPPGRITARGPSGGDITTAQTGTFDPTTVGNLYSYLFPNGGGNGSDFITVQSPENAAFPNQPVGTTNGLLINNAPSPPNPDSLDWPDFQGMPLVVNPIDAQQELVASATGLIFRTENMGLNWFQIANGSQLDGAQVSAMAYGAPDPAFPNNGSLDDFIYAGTKFGNIYVTQNGGGSQGVSGNNPWTQVSFGLDGSFVRQIITDPNRGSHDAYALTNEGVYYLADVQKLLNDINLAQHNPNNPADKVPAIDGWQRIDGAFNANVHSQDPPPNPNTNPPYGTVPNNGTGMTTNTFPGDFNSFPIGHISITVNISASNPANVSAVLVAPNGTQITLFGQGTKITNFQNVTFDDNATTSAYSNNIPPGTTTFQVGSLQYLNAFANMDVQGQWTLKVTDTNANSNVTDTTFISGWSMTVDAVTQQAQTSNVYGITSNAFGDPNQAAPLFGGPLQLTPAYGFGAVTSIAADWRYVIPNSFSGPETTSPTSTHPILYVGGVGGVLQSIDNGQSWSVFPAPLAGSAPDVVPPAGQTGGMPTANVTSLTMSTGDVNPTTGHPIQTPGDPNVMVASTYGNGMYAIRLAPQVFPTSLGLDANNPPPQGSDVGALPTDLITDVKGAFIDGYSEASGFGGNVRITLYDYTNPANPVYIGGFNPALGIGAGNPTDIPANYTDAAGHFSVQIANTAELTDGVKSIGVQATDDSGTEGNVGLFQYTLITATPPTPGIQGLDTGLPTPNGSDSGTLGDQITNVAQPYLDVTGIGTAQTAPMTVDAPYTVILLRSTSASGPFNQVATLSSAAGGTVAIQDLNTLIDTTAGTTDTGTPYYYEAEQEDIAGNISLPSAPFQITYKSTASTPTNLALDSNNPIVGGSSDTGVSGTDNITNDTQPYFVASNIEPGARQLILLRATSVDGGYTPVNTENLTSPSSTIAIQDPGPVQPDGTYFYEVEQVDVAGNTSAVSAPLSVLFVTAPQPAPLTAVLDPTSVTGPAGGHLTADTSPKFDVSGVDLTFPFPSDGPATVFLLRSLSPTGGFTQVAQAQGTAAMMVLQDPGPVPGSVTGITWYYEVRQEDVAGNVSAPSAVVPVTIKSSALTPTQLELDPSHPVPGGSDTGLSNTDDITSDNQPFFIVSSIEPTAREVILLRSSDGGTTFTPVSTLNLTSPSPATVSIQDTGPVQPDGTYVYEAEQVDIVGNISAPSAPLQITVLTTKPSTPAMSLDSASDSGVPGDSITNVTGPTFDISGATVNPAVPSDGPYQIVLLRSTSPNGVFTQVATAPVGSSSTLTVRDGGPLSGNPPVSGNTYYYEVEQEDVAGNFSPPSAPLQITVKTAAQTPNSVALASSSDTGISNSDGVTTNTQPFITASSIEDNATQVILLRATSAGGPYNPVNTLNNPTVTNGSVTIQDPGPVQPDGVYYYEVKQVDIAGNTSLPSTPFKVVVVTSTPTAPSLTLANGGGTGGNVTNSTSPTFDVSGVTVTPPVPGDAPYAVILLRSSTGTAGSFTPVATSGGTTIQDPGPVRPDGNYFYEVEQEDVAGNTSPPSAPLNVLIVTSTPSTPSIALASDSGLAGDNTTNVTSPSFTVSGVTITPPFSGDTPYQVLLLRGTSASGPFTQVAAVAGGSTGSVTIQDPGPLAGTPPVSGIPYFYEVEQEDAAGNVSAPSAPLQIIIKTTAQTPAALELDPASESGTFGSNVTAFTNPTFQVSNIETTAQQVILLRATSANGSYTPVNTLTNPTFKDGLVSIQDPGPVQPDGTYYYEVKQVDVAGNTSPSSSPLAITIDTAPPPPTAAPSLTPGSDTGVSNSDRITQNNGSAQAPLTFAVNVAGTTAVTNPFVRLYDVSGATPVLVGGPVAAVNGVATITINNHKLDDGEHDFATSVAANDTSPESTLSPSTAVTIETSTLYKGDSLTSNFTTVAPGSFTFYFNHPLANLAPGVANGTGFNSNPFAVMLIPSGPDGAATQAQTGTFWTGNDLPVHSTLVYQVNNDGTSQITLTPTVPLGTNLYLLSVQPSLTDLAGNSITMAGGNSGPFYDSFDLRLPAVTPSAPQVVSVTTHNGTTAITPNTNPTIAQPDSIAIRFNKAMDFYQINNTTITLSAVLAGSSTPIVVPAAVTYSPSNDTAYLTPTSMLTPGTKYIVSVSGALTDDTNFPSTGTPLGVNYATSFEVNSGPVTPSTGPFVVTATTPVNGTIAQGPIGYVSVTFSAALSTQSIGRYAIMVTPNPAAPNNYVPVNAQYAFNPNTDQLIIVPTDVLGNAIDYLSLSNLNAANTNAPLQNNIGQAAGVGSNAPYYATWKLALPGTSANVVRQSSSALEFVTPSATTPTVVSTTTTTTSTITPDTSTSAPGHVSGNRVPQSLAHATRRQIRLAMREAAIEHDRNLWLAALEALAGEPVKRVRRV